MSCCKSNEVRTEYKTIYATPDLYFPSYPNPQNNILPLDKDYKRVTDNDTEVVYVIMPYWYYKMIKDYKVSVDEAKAKYEAFESRLK